MKQPTTADPNPKRCATSNTQNGYRPGRNDAQRMRNDAQRD